LSTKSVGFIVYVNYINQDDVKKVLLLAELTPKKEK